MADFFRLLPLLAALVFTGCATQQPMATQTPRSASNQRHLASIADIQDFSVEGRMGVQTEGRGVSGRINWQHIDKKDNISLYSPMGGKIASIITTDSSVTLTSNDGKTYTASDAEMLTQQTLGWRLPVTYLADWVVGRPTKGAIEQSSWDDTGKLIKLTQNGWEVEYLEYYEANGRQLPAKLSLRNPKLYFKLIIERWDTSANPQLGTTIPNNTSATQPN
jgi:outer membrane lipoprotein LolB